jgi:hypothetical protein
LVISTAAMMLSAGVQGQDPIDRIREADIKDDLFTLAGDAMRGREAGTLDEMTASIWLAERARAAGLQPAGDNGTFFQFFPLERMRVSAASAIEIGGKRLQIGRDVIVDAPMVASVDAPVMIASAEEVTGAEAKPEVTSALATRVLVVRFVPAGPATGGQQAMRAWLRGLLKSLTATPPAAIVAIVPDNAADQWARVSVSFPRGTYGLDPDGTNAIKEPRQPRGTPLMYVRESALGGPIAADARVVASIFTDTFTYPSLNIVGKVPGRDPKLAGEHVLFSAHQDHDGERFAVDGDAIWNGADDNATTAVALLAIGRAVSASPGRRSALFVWHGAEERGLMGSRWYVKHPTVPLKSIVAVLNGDMMGRNDPTTAALLGALPPHRNSPQLVEMALAANKDVAGFSVDHSWDDPQHREGWYYRSDHLPYARAGVPALFFSTLLHPDYHTPFDNPDRIDVAKLTKMTRWMYATGRTVMEADAPPAFDPSFKLERCRDLTGNYCQ